MAKQNITHSLDEKLYQNIINLQIKYQIISDMKDSFQFQLKTQSAKPRMWAILQERKIVHFL